MCSWLAGVFACGLARPSRRPDGEFSPAVGGGNLGLESHVAYRPWRRIKSAPSKQKGVMP